MPVNRWIRSLETERTNLRLLLFIPYESIQPSYQNSSTNLPTKLFSLQKKKRNIESENIENEYVSFTNELRRSRSIIPFNWRFTDDILSSIKERMQKHSRRYTRKRKGRRTGAERKICCFHVEFAARREKEREERKWKMERNFSLSATVLRGRRSRNEEV